MTVTSSALFQSGRRLGVVCTSTDHIGPFMELYEAGDDPSRESDTHGRAALLLVESLIHGLIARSVLSVAEGVEVMEVALDTQIAISDDADAPSASMRKVAALLSSLLHSLSMDLPREIPGPSAPDAI